MLRKNSAQIGCNIRSCRRFVPYDTRLALDAQTFVNLGGSRLSAAAAAYPGSPAIRWSGSQEPHRLGQLRRISALTEFSLLFNCSGVLNSLIQ
jgi:hypothetical protein